MTVTQNTAANAGVIDVPWNLVVPTVDVHLVGFGNRFPNDFTLEMLAVLKRCKRIFAAPPIHAPDFGIPEMESLLPLYGPDKSRVKTYAEMVERVFTAASTDPPVAFATYGSAMVGTVATHRILAEAAERGLTVHVTNAVSSFDGIWADFNIEPFYGFEIWEASAFARLEIVPNVWANLLLPQAPIFDMREGLDLTTMSLRTSSSVADLRDHLLHFYPADHMVHYVRSGAGAGPRLVAADVESMPLRDLDHPGRQVGSTLLVPRAKTEPRAKLDFARPAPTAAPPG